MITTGHVILYAWIVQSRRTTESNFEIGTIVVTWLFIINTPETMDRVYVNRILKLAISH